MRWIYKLLCTNIYPGDWLSLLFSCFYTVMSCILAKISVDIEHTVMAFIVLNHPVKR